MVSILFRGIMAVGLITALVNWLQGFDAIRHLNMSSLILAILLGALVNNTVGVPESFRAGIKFCSKRVLRLAVILLGFKLSLAEVGATGYQATVLIGIVSGITLLLTKYVGEKMRVSTSLSILLGSGVSICGAAAVAAVNAITKSDDEEVAYSIGVVTLFGTVFMFLYPLAFQMLHLSEEFYSLWVGISIHEVAQVVAAGFSVSPEVGQAATVVKLTRVLFIIPVTVYLTLAAARQKEGGATGLREITVPWFVIIFLAVVAANSLLAIDPAVRASIITVDGWLMTGAMAALGLELNFAAMRRVGLRPLLLGLISSVFISLLSLAVIKGSGVM